LYEKRHSLIWEGEFTYLDARQYSRTGDWAAIRNLLARFAQSRQLR
jgi:hypothetical protein